MGFTTSRSRFARATLAGIAALATFALTGRRAAAETCPAPIERPPAHLDLQVDAWPYANKGFSAALGLKPRRLPHWELGATVFAFHAPGDFVRLLNPSNDGLDVKNVTVAAFTSYYFGWEPIPHWGTSAEPIRSGLFVGGYLGYWGTTVGGGNGPSAHVDHALVAAQVGYQWFPVGKVLFVEPAAGLALIPKVGGSGDLGGRAYQEPIVTPLAFVNVGVEL